MVAVGDATSVVSDGVGIQGRLGREDIQLNIRTLRNNQASDNGTQEGMEMGGECMALMDR